MDLHLIGTALSMAEVANRTCVLGNVLTTPASALQDEIGDTQADTGADACNANKAMYSVHPSLPHKENVVALLCMSSGRTGHVHVASGR